MAVAEEMTIRGCASEDFNRCNATGGVGGVVVELHSVTDSQGPQGSIFNFGPMESRMDHKSAGARCNDGDGTFRDTILPLGTDTPVPDRLRILHDLMDKALALENSIVSVIGIDGNAHVER